MQGAALREGAEEVEDLALRPPAALQPEDDDAERPVDLVTQPLRSEPGCSVIREQGRFGELLHQPQRFLFARAQGERLGEREQLGLRLRKNLHPAEANTPLPQRCGPVAADLRPDRRGDQNLAELA